MPTTRAMQRVADLLFANLYAVATLLTALVCAWLLLSLTDNALVLNTMPLCAGGLAVTVAAVAVHPEVNWEKLGLAHTALPGLFWGALLGCGAVAVLVGGMMALELAAWVPWEPSGIRSDWRAMPVTGLVVLATGAAGEELFLRGLLLQFLARSITPAGAVAATSLVFALLHGANPDVTVLAQINTALFGALFCIAVLRQRSLWLAMGLHFGWNAAQVVLGSNNSGITIRLTGLNLELRGAEWLSGGDYGLEGGAMASCAALLLGGCVWILRGRDAPARTLWEPTAATGAGAGRAAARDSPDRTHGHGGQHPEADGDATG